MSKLKVNEINSTNGGSIYIGNDLTIKGSLSVDETETLPCKVFLSVLGRKIYEYDVINNIKLNNHNLVSIVELFFYKVLL